MITIIKNGKFTGTQYTEEQFSEEVQEFHKDDTWIDRELFNNFDYEESEDGIVNYGSPTEQELKSAEQQSIKSNFNKNLPTTILVDLLDGTQKELTFNCEEKSSLLIGESISLYERMGKTSVFIWDINDVIYEFSLEEANDIKDTLAKTYLDRLLERQKQIQLIKG